MITPVIEQELNVQVKNEANSSQLYLSMASWAETKGYEGVAAFMYRHSEEERQHMLRLVRFINERGGHAVIPELTQPPVEFDNLSTVFENLLQHEMGITQKINELVHLTLQEKDYTTHNFLQWYVSEQIEEEALARTILDKLHLIGDDSGSGLYLFDRDITKITVSTAGEDGA